MAMTMNCMEIIKYNLEYNLYNMEHNMIIMETIIYHQYILLLYMDLLI